ncbi:cytochrome b [Sandaracinobacter neustonicus]|uniref:Cytochrome b n=1 Tax=Sandaracinobacter neustonicus TaxID=1715348 RepID=A0A501XT36_9SPHN|nr:cytochrome b [Sandaracinobacter neustonicus]TPE63750.1 cytochrome b [Sandaracinobacter neustonicus]
MTAARSSYSAAAITLHWLIALMIIGNFAGGLLMDDLLKPDATAAQKQLGFAIVQLHKSFGLTVLVLSLLRLALRLFAGTPPLPAHMTSIERLLAKLTHWGFYAVMILLPLSGWVMVSASPLGFPTMWFGLFEWPHLPIGTSKAISGGASEAHELLAWFGVALFVLHVGGALKHHFLDRDDVLARMLPYLRRKQP